MTLLCPEFFAVHTLEGITIEGAKHDILWEIHKRVKDGSNEDSVVLAMKELERSKEKLL